MPDSLLEQARRALREQRTEDAQAILINVIAHQPESDEAWVLLAEALTDAGKKRDCLERARAISPRNEAIRRALDSLDGRGQPVPQEKPTPPAASLTGTASPGSAQALLDEGEGIAQAVLLTTDLPETRAAGCELLQKLDAASARDAAHARRWARSTGRSALLKLQKTLSTAIAGLPRDDARLAELREERLRTLAYLK